MRRCHWRFALLAILAVLAFNLLRSVLIYKKATLGRRLASASASVSVQVNHPASHSSASLLADPGGKSVASPKGDGVGVDRKSVRASYTIDRKEISPGQKKQVVKDILDTTGRVFGGQKVRRFPADQVQFGKKFLPASKDWPTGQTGRRRSDLNCKKWAVTCTGGNHSSATPTEAVRRFLFMSDWCVVIVGMGQWDDGRYRIDTTGDSNLIYLSLEDQANLGLGELALSRANDHIARKNLGYLYAVANGAEVIWDFDENNALKFWIEGASPDVNLELNTFANRGKRPLPVYAPRVGNTDFLFNPYPTLGAPTASSSFPSWPRGFPLDSIHARHTFNVSHDWLRLVPTRKIGVLHSLSDYRPDVDAVHRTVFPQTVTFEKAMSHVLMLPRGLYSPYNAQASLHFQLAFFCLYLPVTVSHRVADIWRGYVAQALFKLTDLHLGFFPRPLVTNEVLPPISDGDLAAEMVLFIKTNALLEFLGNWTKGVQGGKKNKLLARSGEEEVERLWIELYERDFVEIQDVFNIQRWMSTLSALGCKFPWLSPTTSHPFKKPFQWPDLQMFDFSAGQPVASVPEAADLSMGGTCPKALRERRHFYTADLHYGSRMEMPSILSHLGQTVHMGGIKALIPHYSRIDKNPGVFLHRQVSNLFRNQTINTEELSEEEIEANYHFYRNDTVIQETDAFFCTFPASSCEAWIPFNKSIVFMTIHRYNLGRCKPDTWRKLDRTLDRLRQDPRHVVGAVSRYDVEYMRYYTGFQDVKLVPSYSGFYTKGLTYRPVRSDILLIRHKGGSRYYPHYAQLVANVTAFKLSYVYDLYHSYSLRSLTLHPAVVILPYAVMTFRIVEMYTLNVPIFIPSARYFRVHGRGLGSDRTSTSAPYCVSDPDLDLKVGRHPSVGLHPYSPNTEFYEDAEAEMYWLQYSDYYEWPHIQWFDDAEDLQRKMSAADLQDISRKMRRENGLRRKRHLDGWCSLVNSVPNYGGHV